MNPRLQAALMTSAVLHLAVMLALLLGLPSFAPKDEEPPETTVAMVFQGPAQASMQAPTPAQLPAPAKEVAPPAPQVTESPKPEPIEAPPPPPPPPPPRLTAEVTPSPLPPPPPPQPSPDVKPPPQVPPSPPVQASPDVPPPSPVPAPPLPPPQATSAPVIPPPAPPAPAPPKPEPPLPLPPPAAPAPPSPLSATAQPNETRNPAPNSNSVESTLEKLRQQLAQTQPPKARSNPRSGGQPNGGGNPLSNDTAALSTEQRGAIGDHVRECWTKDAGALDIDKQRVLLTVTTDAGGTARKADVAGSDVARMSDPRFRAFAERAMRAIMDARCATLPLPTTALGRVNVLTFRFSP